MANQYSIKIKNNSGVFRNYYIFSALPQVTPKVNGKLWSNILAVAHVQPNQSATFTIYKQYFAIVGNSSGTPAQGVMVNVSGYKDVTLGSQSPNGDLIPGTTLELDASDGAPYFTDNSVPDGGQVNAFQVKAPVGGSHFTIPDAKQGNFIVGLGGSASGNASGTAQGPAATFMPEPNASYQIKPKNQYYLTFGSFTPGQLIDVTMMSSDTVSIDFSDDNASTAAYVVNNNQNQLLKQNQPF